MINKQEELFKEVLRECNIVDIIAKYVDLNENGTFWEGKCPFNEKCGKSFAISETRKTFYCFGCNTSGDVISFLSKYGNMNKLTAARFLKKMGGNTEQQKPEVEITPEED